MDRELWGTIDRYFNQKLHPGDEVLDAVLEASAAAGLPAIQVTPNQGKFLYLLARVHQSRTILELGTLGGYSTIWLARALPATGVLITLEADPQAAAVARRNFAAAGLDDRIALREGPALESLEALAADGRGPFDLFFLDADKENHANYFEWALKLSRPGSLIVADNVVRNGEIVNPDTEDQSISGIRDLCDLLEKDPRVEATALQTVGSKGHDGFILARVV